MTSLERQAPTLRTVEVARTENLSPLMVRVTLTGAELEGFEIPAPASSVRLLVPSEGTSELIMPEWNGNEFLLPNGDRPAIRTFTPRRFDRELRELDLDIVIHDGGAVSGWAEQVQPGDPAAVTDPGRGYQIDPTARSFLLAGDETAIPAISQLLEELEPGILVRVIIEARPRARQELPDHPEAEVTWIDPVTGEPPGRALSRAVTSADLEPGTKVWVAGEAGSLVPIRKHFKDVGLDRSDVTIRGYWKPGR